MFFVIKYAPKRVGLERAEVEHDGDKHVPQSLLVQGQRKMMMVNDVVTFFRPQDDRYHVLANVGADLLRLVLS
jgi:hypothetical protein